ncbi:GNAT family N-acetyltransferase [Halobacteriales archaeon Cl-PHB]
MTRGTVRRARVDDYDDVVAFTADTWAEREDAGDYIPDVFHDWVESDGPNQRTVVAEIDGDVAGLCQGLLLTDHEAWLQGMRVNPDYRGGDVGELMDEDLFDWAVDNGATVARNIVFSWNDAGLGQSLAAGFDPRCSFRWAHPTPRETTPSNRVGADPGAAWSYWTRSDARTSLAGLNLHPDQSWAVSELTRDRLDRLADEQRVFTVTDDGTRGFAYRTRTTEGHTDEGHQKVAEYGVAAWADCTVAADLFDTIRADAAALGVDQTRVLIPETPRHVAEAATVRAEPSDWPSFVFEADLTARRTER